MSYDLEKASQPEQASSSSNEASSKYLETDEL